MPGFLPRALLCRFILAGAAALTAVAAVAAALTPVAAVAADLPPEIVEDTDRALVFCQDLGGTPSILPGYERRLDLNGDGREDVVTDQAGLACAGAASAFCGTAGCPVSAWLSRPEPEPGLERFDFGYLQGYQIVEGAGAGGRPGLRAAYHGSACDGERIGAEGCTRLWIFTSNAPDVPPMDAPAVAAAPPVAADAAAPAGTPPAPMPEGWTLRRVPGGDPVALAAGPGEIATLAAFCLEGRSFLAVTFHGKPEADPVPLRFAFTAGAVEVAAGYEPTAGGSYVAALEGSPLAARLAGRDTSVTVQSNGADQGVLSLKGSTRALRGALEICNGL